VTRIQAERPKNLGSIPGKGKSFISSVKYQTIWGLHNFLIQWELGAGVKLPDLRLITPRAEGKNELRKMS
jgi:hypothetical protein